MEKKARRGSSARQHQSREGRSGAREGVWRRRREGDLLLDSIKPVWGGAARGRGDGEEGAKDIFCATASIQCGEERRAGGGMEKKARRGSSARQHQSRAGRSGAWEGVWRRRRAAPSSPYPLPSASAAGASDRKASSASTFIPYISSGVKLRMEGNRDEVTL